MFANINHATVRSAEHFQRAMDSWHLAIQKQSGFLGFLTLKEQEHPDRLVIVTLWESPAAAREWNQNSDFAHLRETEIAPNLSDWTFTPTTVEAAELPKVVV